jgi:signal transduction histidine kinase
VDDSEAVAHVVSHDLRNPLDVAAAHLELARDERDGEHLRRVAEAHERMEQIIRDVLTLARGERAISPSEGVDLGAVVTDAWDSIAADDVELSVSGVPTATADRPRVERLVENLLRNAVDHAGPAPTIYAGGLPDDAGFYVADDGDGVPTDVREAVFEPGYTESGDGTGLGLAIVRRIAAAHGWSVRLADSDAGGARVEVWFDDPPEETA